MFDFWLRASTRLTADLPRPYDTRELYRIDDTPMHQALREALANMLLHADYLGTASCVASRSSDCVTFTNPGVPLIPTDVAMAGGVSVTRNPTLMKMFNLVSIGERAGSGFDTMRQGTASAHLTDPVLTSEFWPDRTVLEIQLPARYQAETSRAQELLDEAFDPVGHSPKARRESVREAIIEKNPAASHESIVLAFINATGPMSRSEIADTLGLAKSTASNLLSRMAKAGLLKSIGRGPSTRYVRP